MFAFKNYFLINKKRTQTKTKNKPNFIICNERAVHSWIIKLIALATWIGFHN